MNTLLLALIRALRSHGWHYPYFLCAVWDNFAARYCLMPVSCSAIPLINGCY